MYRRKHAHILTRLDCLSQHLLTSDSSGSLGDLEVSVDEDGLSRQRWT